MDSMVDWRRYLSTSSPIEKIETKQKATGRFDRLERARYSMRPFKSFSGRLVGIFQFTPGF
jgi:hypothetical protein